jgi:hypothetical protein
LLIYLQLSSVSALQSSFDTLSQHKPEYTPRTGFAWPIIAAVDETGKHRREGQPPTDSQTADDVSVQEDKEPKNNAKKPQMQNVKLLEFAMVSAKLHSKLPELVDAPATATAAPTPAAPARSSATPAPAVPSSQPVPTPGPLTQEPPTKAPPGAGKKKKKREIFRLFEYHFCSLPTAQVCLSQYRLALDRVLDASYTRTLFNPLPGDALVTSHYGFRSLHNHSAYICSFPNLSRKTLLVLLVDLLSGFVSPPPTREMILV